LTGSISGALRFLQRPKDPFGKTKGAVCSPQPAIFLPKDIRGFSTRSFLYFYVFSALEKLSFQVMISPLAPTLPPLGAGAHCDASALPKLEIPPR
jgi:hypothetical protein